MPAVRAATRRWPRGSDLEPGGTAHTVVLSTTLVAALCAWTVGISRVLFEGRETPLALALQLGGPILLGVAGAAFGIRWGRDRRAALEAATTSEVLLRASNTDLAHASELIRAILETSPVATLAFDRDGNITFWSAAAERVFGWPAADVLGRPLPGASLFESELTSSVDRVDRLLAGSMIQGERVRRRSRDGRELVLERYGGPLIGDGVAAGYAGQMIDITDREQARIQLERLGAAIDQTVDGVLVADGEGVIVYVNPAYEKQSGYAAVDLIGGHQATIFPRIMGDDVHESASRAVLEGVPWLGEVEQRRGDGSTSRVQLSITPVRAPSGAINGFVAFQHDVTYMRAMEGDLALEAGVRGVLGVALHQIPPEASLHEAAQAVCEGLCSLPGIDFASVDVFLDPEDAVVIALKGPEGFPHDAGDHHSPALSRRLSQASRGPWAEYWALRAEDEEMGAELDRAGLRAFAYAPIVHGDHVDGGVGIGTSDPAFARTLVERVPLLVDFNTAPSALLAERLHGYRCDAAIRTALGEVIERHAFHPVFQPIVELASSEVVGYEALTRFDAGQPPDLAFANARAAGLGAELELATLEAAVAASLGLPAGLWLAVNVSPALLERPEALRRCLANAYRPLVLEVTEHEHIVDYPAVRAAVHSLGADVRFAVDDAGAGIANFAHIIELDADLVKLDISLVRGVNSSAGRQALVLALCHFARTAGCRLVAEGVETEDEAITLAKFGVEFGQGYWFGHPAPLPVGEP